jgi:hypothetical protein
VKLQQLELQSDLQKRNADEQLRQYKDREIGQRDDRYYDAK